MAQKDKPFFLRPVRSGWRQDSAARAARGKKIAIVPAVRPSELRVVDEIFDCTPAERKVPAIKYRAMKSSGNKKKTGTDVPRPILPIVLVVACHAPALRNFRDVLGEFAGALLVAAAELEVHRTPGGVEPFGKVAVRKRCLRFSTRLSRACLGNMISYA